LAQIPLGDVGVRPLIPSRVTELVMDKESFDRFRAFVLARIDQLDLLELSSPSARDECCAILADQLLKEAASKRLCQDGGPPAWTTPLGDVCMLVLADERVLEDVGNERLIQMAHEDYVRQARDAGEPHHAASLAFYDARAASMQREEERTEPLSLFCCG
jgi:hypothetical protein